MPSANAMCPRKGGGQGSSDRTKGAIIDGGRYQRRCDSEARRDDDDDDDDENARRVVEDSLSRLTAHGSLISDSTSRRFSRRRPVTQLRRARTGQQIVRI
ncbi:hypothetical protein N431DRAFT_464705 [Stipitochalara longipes BDJ]|nr:hypothetical protein N431DRAFT_464705 [Stipitochalara longipes BDJ]